jgi:nitrogenase molybdenum-iron protein alpha/beta subunit
MLATILKSPQATAATIAIIETFAKVRELKRELVELHKETDKDKQSTKMQHFGEVLTDIVMSDLETSETESSLEINFLIGKIKHTVKRVRKENKKKD